MSAPTGVDSLPTLEEQAFVCLHVLLLREQSANVPLAQRRVSMSHSAPGGVQVMTVSFPVEENFVGYTPALTVQPWLA